MITYQSDQALIAGLNRRVAILESENTRLKAELDGLKNPKPRFASICRIRNTREFGSVGNVGQVESGPTSSVFPSRSSRDKVTPLFPNPQDPDPKPPKKQVVEELPVTDGIMPILQLPETRVVASAVALLPAQCESTIQKQRRAKARKETVLTLLLEYHRHQRNVDKDILVVRNIRTQAFKLGKAFGVESIEPCKVTICLNPPKPTEVSDIPDFPRSHDDIPYISAHCMGLLMAANTFEPWGINSDWLTLFDKERFAEMRPLKLLRVTTYPKGAMEFALSDLGKVAVEEFDVVSDERGQEAVEVMIAALELVADHYAKTVATNPPIGITPKDLEALIERANRNQTRRSGLRPVA